MPDVTGLFDSFLETAASMAVLFIVVAWVSSKIVELFQLGLNMHGRVLRSELERCFGEDSGETSGRFTRYFYWHPMIVPLTQPSLPVTLWRRVRANASSDWRRLRSLLAPLWPGSPGEDPAATTAPSPAADPCYPPGRLPAHIAPETFAAVVMNPFPWPTTEEPFRRMLEANLDDVTPNADPANEGEQSASAPRDPVRELAKRLVHQVRMVHPGETWGELLARPAVKAELDKLGTFEFKQPFLEASVDPAGAAPDRVESLRRLFRPHASESISNDRLREIAREIGDDKPVPPESWRDFLARAGIGDTAVFSADFLGRRARLPAAASDPSDRYFHACSCNDLVPHELETRIVTLLRDADGDVEEFRAGLKRWYAEAMERVTGRFKRAALIMLFAVALLICAAFNLNALTILDGLIGNPELRGLGVQASRAIGDNPRGMAALGQKLQFQDIAGKCPPPKKVAAPAGTAAPAPAPAKPCDPHEVLTGLWSDHSQPVIIDDEPTFPATPVKEADVAALQMKQIDYVRNQCPKVDGLCSPAFTPVLNRCESSASSGAGAPDQAAAAAAPAAPPQAKAGPGEAPPPASPPQNQAGRGADTGAKNADEACKRAWSAIWRNPDFFWHPEAAHKFASHLWGGATLTATDQLDLVRNLGEQAAADTGAVKKYLTMLPSVGWGGWEERVEEFNKRPFWVFFGIFLSAALAALGAPFWYDVLGKVSGRSGARSRGEKA